MNLAHLNINTIRYTLLLLAALPCLPFLFWEGKRIRKSIPKLIEPADNKGVTGNFSQSIHVLVLGESTMAGVGVSSHREGFTGHLAASLSSRLQRKINWQVVAKSGTTAATAADLLTSLPAGPSPDLIVVGLGGNDTFRFRSPWAWRRDLERLIGRLHGQFPGKPILFANMPPTSSFPAFSPLVKFLLGNLTELLRQELEDLAKGYTDVHFDNSKITLKQWVTAERPVGALFSDGVHPSGLTYQLWANELGTFVLENGILKI